MRINVLLYVENYFNINIHYSEGIFAIKPLASCY